MISREKMHLNSVVGQFAYLAEETGIAYRYDIFVVVSKIKQIDEHIYRWGVRLYVVEKTNKPAFLHASVFYCQRTEMGIGYEVYVFHDVIT